MVMPARLCQSWELGPLWRGAGMAPACCQRASNLPQLCPGFAEPMCPLIFILLVFLTSICAIPEDAMATGPQGWLLEKLQLYAGL